MPILVTSDLHFTSKPLDAYRWDLFPWLRKMIKQHDVSDVAILGDLTDDKDRHEATLVNRLVDSLEGLTVRSHLWILKANHDYVDENVPFFGFTRHIEGITYVSMPRIATLGGMRVALLPNTKDHQATWSDVDLRSCAYIFCHQTFDGAKAENGARLRGIPPSYFDDLPKTCKVISGDIHVPQSVGKRITYVGSPYRVHFGDAFEPRVLLIEGSKWVDLRFPCPSREVIDITSSKFVYASFPRGTQVKIRVHLRRQEFGEKDAIRDEVRKAVESRGWELCSLEWKLRQVHEAKEQVLVVKTIKPADLVRDYAVGKKLAKEVTALGLGFVEEAGQCPP